MKLASSQHALSPIKETNQPDQAASKLPAARLSHSVKRSTLKTANSLTFYVQQDAAASAGLSISLGKPSATLPRTGRRPGLPTVSTALEPGPYHMANAQVI